MYITHEAPISILRDIRKVTDYDYALVHLFETKPEYFSFFQESLEQGRRVILDNSIFELGEAFDYKKFAYWVDLLKPTEYIIPDVLENSERTILNLANWRVNFSTLPGVKIGVVQGKTYEEVISCYKAIDDFCDKIAISFDYSLYQSIFPHPNKIVSWSMGRVQLINQLLKDGIINKNKPHHLLGCSTPMEFLHYKYSIYSFIDTVDTSNPVVHGLRGITYPENGLWEKESIKLVELLSVEPSLVQLENIYSNISKFRKLVN